MWKPGPRATAHDCTGPQTLNTCLCSSTSNFHLALIPWGLRLSSEPQLIRPNHLFYCLFLSVLITQRNTVCHHGGFDYYTDF